MTNHKGEKSIEEGSTTPIYLALLPEGSPSAHGKFWRDAKEQSFVLIRMNDNGTNHQFTVYYLICIGVQFAADYCKSYHRDTIHVVSISITFCNFLMIASHSGTNELINDRR